MRVLKNISLLLFLSISFFSCKNNSEYLIEKGSVGKINKTTTVGELKAIFSKDSLVVNLSEVKGDNGEEESKYFRDDDEYILFDNKGKHMLTIIPITQHDSLSTIKSVEIFNNKYKTIKGISLYSPYKDILAAYQLSITNTLLSAHIDIDELNATMSIDKKEIGINEFNREKIKPNQIPDLANIKHFTVWFN